MFDKEDHYFLKTKNVDGIPRFFISFKDVQGIWKETEVTQTVFAEFARFAKEERNLRRWNERHIEQSELTDETLNRRVANPSKALEETVIGSLRNKCLRLAIQKLPEIQRRRFLLHHERGFAYEQIAVKEGCSRQTVTRSVERAEKKIKEAIKFSG